MSIKHVFRDPETRKPMMATLSSLNNGSALELHQAILNAAVEQFIINPDLHTLTEFTLTDFCIFVPRYVCYRHELYRTIEPLPDDTEVEKDSVVLLSRYDVGKLLLTAEKRYGEIRAKIVQHQIQYVYFSEAFPCSTPGYWSAVSDIDFADLTKKYLSLPGSDVVEFIRYELASKMEVK